METFDQFIQEESVYEKKKILREYFIDTVSEFAEKAIRFLGLKYTLPLVKLDLLYENSNVFGMCGMYDTGGIALQFNCSRFVIDEDDLDSKLYDYFEYPAYASNPQIGALKSTNWKNVCQCAAIHELVHCISFSCYVPAIYENFEIVCKKLGFNEIEAKKEVDTADGTSPEAHGPFFQAGLHFLRPKLYKPIM